MKTGAPEFSPKGLRQVPGFLWVLTINNDWVLVQLSSIVTVRPSTIDTSPVKSVLVLNTLLEPESKIPSPWTLAQISDAIIWAQAMKVIQPWA